FKRSFSSQAEMRNDLRDQLLLLQFVVAGDRAERTAVDVDLTLLADHDHHGLGVDTLLRLAQQDAAAVEYRLDAIAREPLRRRDVGLVEALEKRGRGRLPRLALGIVLGAFGFELCNGLVERRHIASSTGTRQPTEPSRLIEISFCASTANSIGSCCSTSLTKPLTTSATASSAESPRWRQ